MSNVKTIRTWKEEEYRLSLSDAELANLPENPAGLIDLTDLQISSIGGAGSKKNAGSVVVNNVIPIVPSSYGSGVILPITITNITGSGFSG